MKSKKIFLFRLCTLGSSFCFGMEQPTQERLYMIDNIIFHNNKFFKITRITEIRPKVCTRRESVTDFRETQYHAKRPIVPYLLEHNATFVQKYDSKQITCRECKPRPTLYAYAGLAALTGYGIYSWFFKES